MATTIALTGGMGCGKSAAAEAFKELGAKVMDADSLSHFVLENDPYVIGTVKRVAGESAYGADGKALRENIAKAVFSDAKKLAEIENAIHPAVEKMWREELKKCDSSADMCFAVVEIPLLFEKRLENKFDICVSVFCSEALRKERLLSRGMTAEEILRRDAFQMSPLEKAKLADIVLFNESHRNFLKRQVELVLSRLK